MIRQQQHALNLKSTLYVIDHLDVFVVATGRHHSLQLGANRPELFCQSKRYNVCWPNSRAGPAANLLLSQKHFDA